MKRKIILSKKMKICLVALALAVWLAGAYVLGVNFYVVLSQNEKFITQQEASQLQIIDYAVVLGCGIKNGKPSDMLHDRLSQAVKLMEESPSLSLIISGDNSGEEYNEVGVMYDFLVENGVDESRLITDNIGFSTGESVENLKNVYNAERVVIVTQDFHLYRALFITEKLGIEAYGLEAAHDHFTHHYYSSLREIFARNKDFLKYTF